MTRKTPPILKMILVFLLFLGWDDADASNTLICNIKSLGPAIDQILLRPVREITADGVGDDKVIVPRKFRGTVLVAKKDETLYRKSFGYADEAVGNLNKPESRFEIASITKQFTAAAILKLHEQGVLNIKDRIAKYISQVPLDNRWQRLTIEDLLTHKSGSLGYYDFSVYPEKAVLSLEQYANLIFKVPLRSEPGHEAQYSNLGYVLLAFIIEKTSNQQYENFISSKIFVPLGMENTNFTDGIKSTSDIVKPHDLPFWSKENNPEIIDFKDVSFMQGAGNMYSTVDDLLKWHRALLHEKVISKKMLDEMITPRSDALGRGFTYGYGIKSEKFKNYLVVGHGGNGLGYKSDIRTLLGGDITIVLLTNEHYLDSFQTWTEQIRNLVFSSCM